MSDSKQNLRVALFGATGTAGSAVLRACLDEPRITEVISIGRRSCGVQSAKLREVLVWDFLEPDPDAIDVSGIDHCFFCMGVSQMQVRDEARYREFTYDYAMATARALLLHSPQHVFHLLSGLGTDSDSRAMWARIKGQTEDALQELGLAGVICWRPGYLRTTGPAPLGKRLARLAYPLFSLFPSQSLTAHEFGQGMVQVALEGRREGIMENLEIVAAANRYPAGL
jgi:uncharacterized protein YbjT (DUF2867 family)